MGELGDRVAKLVVERARVSSPPWRCAIGTRSSVAASGRGHLVPIADQSKRRAGRPQVIADRPSAVEASVVAGSSPATTRAPDGSKPSSRIPPIVIP